MNVLAEILSPGVQDRRHSDTSAQMTPVTAEVLQCLRSGTEQQTVNQTRFALGQHVQLVWKREDDVEVRDRQQVCLPGQQPALPAHALTLGTMPVAARAIDDACGAARVAGVECAAEHRSSAAFDVAEGTQLDTGQRTPTANRAGAAPDNVGEFWLVRRPALGVTGVAHGSAPRSVGKAQQIQRRTPHEPFLGHVQVASSCCQATMAE